MRLSRFPISTLLDSASGHLEAHLYKKRLAAESGEPLAQQYSGIIFSGKRQGLAQFLTVIPRDAEQVHHVPVEVVIDLGVAAGFPEQDGGCTAEGLDVSVMWRQVLDDPGSKFPLASVVAQDWATNPFHDVLSCSALRRLSWSRS